MHVYLYGIILSHYTPLAITVRIAINIIIIFTTIIIIYNAERVREYVDASSFAMQSSSRSNVHR